MEPNAEYELITFPAAHSREQTGTIRVIGPEVGAYCMAVYRLENNETLTREAKATAIHSLVSHLNACAERWVQISVLGTYPWLGWLMRGGQLMDTYRCDQPYCALTVNHWLRRFGMWLPSTAEVQANQGMFFLDKDGHGVAPIPIIEGLIERNAIVATAGRN